MRTDAELIQDYAASRSELAFAGIVERHGPMIYRACLHLLRDAHEAEDAAQATFIVLARRAAALPRAAPLAA